ncbi:MAG: peptidoglycan editing factor PgeF [Devosia sp.]
MIDFASVQSLTDSDVVRHGFFGRHGGVSTGDYAGLNVSHSVGDDTEAVEENRALVAKSLGGAPLVTVRQVHSNRVVTVEAGALPEKTVEADALVTRRADVLIGVLTADCSPLLLVDRHSGVVGAAHAGWRGAVDGILANTVAAMEASGAQRRRIQLAIGPTISQKNYEVGEQFKADALNQNANTAAAFLTLPGGKPHFDLPGYLAIEARALGLAEITDTALCTYADPARFFSHRYATHQQTKTGRQIAVIGLA